MYLVKKLIDFGLSEKEARIYIALLELEIGSVQEITRKTGLNRSSIYVVLSSLQKRGLVSIASSEGVTKYVSVSPNQLLRLAKEDVEKYTLLKQNFNMLLPKLKIIQKGATFKPRIIVNEGDDGIIKSFESTLKAKEKNIRICSSANYPMANMREYFISYLKKRFERGLRMRGIHPNNESSRQIISHSPKNFDEMLLIPKETFNFPSDIAIWDNKIGFMSTKEAFAPTIESKDMADTAKTIFDLAREEAKRLAKTTK